MKRNPILDFEIDKSKIQYVGHDLQRPECILAEPDCTLWAADARGGVMQIKPDGTQQIVTQKLPPGPGPQSGRPDPTVSPRTATSPMPRRSVNDA